MNVKNIALTVAVSTLVVVLGLTLFGQSKVERIIERVVDLGASPGPKIDNPFLDVNGVLVHYAEGRFTSATTTPLAIQSPRTSTSTLLMGSGCRFNHASTTAAQITLAKAATAYATTTALVTTTIAASAAGTITATTSVANDFVFAPGNWFVVGMAGGIGTFSPTGRCVVRFLEI